MPFVDTHCHLDFSAFDGQLDALIRRCAEKGITRFVVPSVTVANWQSVITLSEKYPSLSCALGLHPCFMNEHSDASDLKSLSEVLQNTSSKIVAVGEMGLDFRLDEHKRQIALFDAQLSIAEDFQLPVIVHSVKAHETVYQCLKRHSIRAGVVHAFAGSYEQAKRYVDLGFKIGVGSIICHARAQKTRATVSKLNLNDLVLETDSPDMVLPGHSKGSASPLDLERIFAELCAIRCESREEIERALWANSAELFRLCA